jgi:IS66 C-terminal element
MGRKNYLFMGSDSGRQRAAALYSLVATAKLNGLDPVCYLRAVLAQIPEHPINRILVGLMVPEEHGEDRTFTVTLTTQFLTTGRIIA